MNRRRFIAGAMGAVAVAYSGGTFELNSAKLEWSETYFDYDRYYGLCVSYTKSNGEVIKQAIKMTNPFIKGKFTNATSKVHARMKTDMRKMLLKWLEETIDD